MKLFRIPDPWDYHGQGAVIIMAQNKNAAIDKVKALADKANREGAIYRAAVEELNLQFPIQSTNPKDRVEAWQNFYATHIVPSMWQPSSSTEYDKIEELIDGVYFDQGCDD